ncbi:hypothetical protein JCM9140_1365 [Halalkalibacter wakoensis JCM 9140]|uniref:TcaA protein NTF2-like domain-containing protein n=1 Tax=Halalkalibacter wakoensis JCM 9140 TaxID=1236970 RepID=W4Q1X0_9BACI|nr:hypothetical protein JCM9140_1365 [Halalkalibacter wakoensis JCM 9140]
MYIVHTFEQYTIYYNDGTAKYKTFHSSYDVNVTGADMKMMRLIETNQVEESIDL